MGFCTRRHFLLTICILQLISTIERQVFDFLGFLWAPIFANFFHVIFVIFGFFGAFQYRPRYIITYVTWCIIWIGWNIFLICFYLSIGALDKDSDVLNLGTGTVSWFEVNGYGCRPMFPSNLTVDTPDPFRPIRPEKVNSCLLDYEYVEVLHSAIQCALAIMGGIAGIFLSQIFLEEDDSSQANKLNSKLNGNRTSLYSIEFSHNEDSLEDDQQMPPPLSPRPMTPRRVKRRSETARNSLRHHSNRNSLRASQRRRHIQNPVTRLIEQQQLGLALQNSRAATNLDTSTEYDPNSSHFNVVNQSFAVPNRPYRLDAPNFNKVLDNALSSRLIEISTRHTTGVNKPRLELPRFQEQNFNGKNFEDELMLEDSAGHTNPTYQQSSMQSLNEEDLYNNRPGSARSSYSNYHGTRTISYVNPSSMKPPHLAPSERPISQINEGFPRSISQVHEASTRAISYIDNGGIKQLYFQGQATAQVPTNHRRSTRRNNNNASTFMQSGPPAYHVQGTVVSETVI